MIIYHIFRDKSQAVKLIETNWKMSLKFKILKQVELIFLLNLPIT
jgi:hypothetical protein